MRLPHDATLIVIDADEPSGAPQAPPPGSPAANVAALLAAWRREELPLVRARSLAPGEEHEAPAEGVRLGERLGEGAVVLRALSAFAGTGLEGLLEEIGATTLVLCGAPEKVAASARDAVALGYQVFVVADACPVVDGPSALEAEDAALVDAATALGAAAMAKFRVRWRAERSGAGPRGG